MIRHAPWEMKNGQPIDDGQCDEVNRRRRRRYDIAPCQPRITEIHVRGKRRGLETRAEQRNAPGSKKGSGGTLCCGKVS